VTDPAALARAAAYREAGEWGRSTIAGALRASAERRPDAPALASPETVLTYRELDERSDRMALGLLRRGLGRGTAVIFQMGTEVETVVAFYGVLKAGLVPVCSIPNHRLHEVSLIAAATGARAHLFQGDYRNYDLTTLSAELAERCPDVTTRIVARGTVADGTIALDELCATGDAATARAAVDAVQAELDPESIAVFQLSGGTTGVPKIIPHTHATSLSAARRWSANLQWNEQSVNLHFLPIMHHAGLGTMLLPTHVVGGLAVLCRQIDAATIVGLVERHRVTWMHFNLAAYEPLIAYAAEHECDFGSVTHFSWTFIRPEMSAKAEELLGATVVGSFGMGEGVHLSCRRDDADAIRRFTVGSEIGAHDEVTLLQPDSEEPTPAGELGELCFRGPSVITGYFEAPEVNATAFTSDGFLRSGDLGRALTIEGRLVYTIEGRLKDQISRGGEKFMAAELEALLAQHPDVSEVVAVGMPDARLGERVAVFVVPATGAPTDPEALRRGFVSYLDGLQVAKFKWPERVEVVDSIPKTGIGKPLKHVLRERLVTQETE
jgi:2,3-dihydroxybenzoate-AMP ligase